MPVFQNKMEIKAVPDYDLVKFVSETG